MAVKVKLTFSTDTYTVKDYDLPEGTILRLVGSLVFTEKGDLAVMKDVSKSRPELEVSMLKGLAEASYRSAKKMSEIHTAADLWAQFDSLKDEPEIVIEDSDHKMLSAAFETMGEQRNTLWCRHCTAMIEQLSFPQKAE